MAWNIGANDVANAMGTSVGSTALTLRQAVVLAAIFEFAGAFFFGSHVAETVQSGIVSMEVFTSEPLLYVYGMLSALLAAGVWLQVASYFGWPVSTTQSIIGAVIGFGLVVAGTEAIMWGEVVQIVLSWVLSPLLGGLLSLYLFSLLRDRIFYAPRPLEATKKIAPFLTFILGFILTVTLLQSGMRSHGGEIDVSLSIVLSSLVALAVSIGSYIYFSFLIRNRRKYEPPSYYQPEVMIGLGKLRKHLLRIETYAEGEMLEKVASLKKGVEDLGSHLEKGSFAEIIHEELQLVERLFSKLQIFSACLMAFAHGANDVANAIGPLAGSVQVLLRGEFVQLTVIPTWALALGGFGIVAGLATWGWRVIETVGKKITELTPSRGFSAELGAAMTVLLASRLGIPISATHTLVGSVLGVGMARGIGAINLGITRDILASWVITLPAGALLSILFFALFRVIF